MQNKKSLNHLAIIMDGNGRWAINQEITSYCWTCSRRTLSFKNNRLGYKE
jgi:undecaprenyl pyrophosphate synthase